MECYRLALKINSEHSDSLWGLGRILLILGECLKMLNKFEEAQKYYKEALKYDPKNVDCYQGIGIK
jgi:tetratricopeptide (TPR) repeat protein